MDDDLKRMIEEAVGDAVRDAVRDVVPEAVSATVSATLRKELAPLFKALPELSKSVQDADVIAERKRRWERRLAITR